jgi:hypothetical protein
MTNEHENIIGGVYWDDIGAPGWNLLGYSNDTKWTAEEGGGRQKT